MENLNSWSLRFIMSVYATIALASANPAVFEYVLVSYVEERGKNNQPVTPSFIRSSSRQGPAFCL